MSGIGRLDLEHDVVEIARRRRVRNGFQHLEALRGKLRVEQLGKTGAERRILMHDHHGFGRLAGFIVDGDEVGERGLGQNAKTRAEAEGVLQAAGDDGVGDADVDDIRQIVAGRGLGRRQADRAGVAADDRRHAGRIHLFDFGVAAVRRRLRVTQHRLDLGAAHAFDAAAGVDFVDRDRSAEPALLSGIRQRARKPAATGRLSRPRLGPATARAQRACRSQPLRP